MLLLGSTPVQAYTTDIICEGDPKYGCTYVDFSSNDRGGWDINHRYYSGSTGNSPDTNWWQLYYAKDWVWSGSQWVFLVNWGSGPTYSNTSVDIYREQGSSDSIANVNVTVTMRNRFHRTDGSYWCSLIHEMHLWDRSALRWGNTDCNPA